MKISFVGFIPKAVVLLAMVGSEWLLGQARGEMGPGARAAGQERSRAELAAQDLVSLSAETVIGLLRREPGLLLQVKRVLVRAAYEQGRLLDPEDLSDEALFRLVREDQTIRVLVTQEIERRSYIHAKPTREERTRGLAADTRELGTEGGAARERETTLDPRQQLERTDKRPPVDEYTDPLPVDAAPMPKVRPEELPGLLLASGGSKLSGGNTDPESISGSGPDPAPDSTGPDSPPRQAGQPPGVDAGKGSSAGRIGPQTEGSVTMDLAPDRAGLHHRANPYADIPSLYDFYQQYSGRPAQVERFGADVFRNGTGNFNDLPMDLPVGPEYVLGPGDGLSISLWGGVSRRLQSVVDRQGRVALPEVGAVEVSGKSLGDVQLLVQSALRTQFRDVQADISLARLRAVRIYVVGDVQRPGAYDVSSLSTPLNALYQAGGPTARGSLRVVRHYRGRRLVQEIDVYDLLLHGIRSGLLGLQAGDTILVPPLGSEIAIEGMVRRPARYELNGETSLAQALELAGGVLRSGTLRHIDVERVDAHISRDMLRLDIPEDNDPGTVTKVLEEFRVQDGDKIKISPILPYAEKTVYLDGHVFRPGKFAYREGMKVTDIIRSYNELLPEPYKKHAEVIRLNPPDYSPVVLAFNLDDAFAGKAQDLVLKPFDTIRVFGRFEFEDPPLITINGEVRDPGDHITNGATYLRDAVYLAGGATPDALWSDVQIFRKTEDGKLKVLSADLKQAMEGDAKENLLLEPRDRIFIHRNLNKVDPPTVKIEGEVARPGKYPLGESMTAVDLVRVAGGMKRGAFTEAADLTRYEVENGSSVAGEHRTVSIARALAGEPDTDMRLHDGDVLTVRQIAGWTDLGATIEVRGEVLHPGTYGLKEGERLSAILERAGGLRGDAYPYGAVFERMQVRDLEEKRRAQLIGEVQGQGASLRQAPENDEDQRLTKTAAILQWQTTIGRLQNTPPSGRLVIHITRDSKRWANTSADVLVRAGDSIYIPKRPGLVLVDGAVYNPTAVSFKPGKSAGWYLQQAGGPTSTAEKKAVFVIRADGSVVGGSGGLFSGGVEHAALQAGDMVVVPEKGFSANSRWKNILQSAQLAYAVGVAIQVSRSF